MATPAFNITPQFKWVRTSGLLSGVSLAVLLGAFLRFYQIDSLPPGITPGLAGTGLAALSWLAAPSITGLSGATDFAPAWLLLQSLAVWILGPSELALRLWSAALGSLAVLTTWLWLRSWFDSRIALLGALVLAANPTAITIDRLGSIAAIAPLLLTLGLWLTTRAWRTRKLVDILLAGTVLVATLAFGPFGWLSTAIVGLLGAIMAISRRRKLRLNRVQLIGVGGVVVLLAIAGFAIGLSGVTPAQVVNQYGLASGIGAISQTKASVLAMLAVPGSGDTNYQHNLAGQPVFNAFFALMLVAGFLAALGRIGQLRYQRVLIVVLLALVPATLTTQGAPNSARLMLALPALAALVAIGISYMLELWYNTFPINSAARTAGLSSLVVLMGLSLVLGYTHYFRAWGNLAEVRTAHSEGAVRLAANLKNDKSQAQKYLVATADEQTVVNYLSHRGPGYIALTPQTLTGLPTGPGARKFYITPTDRAAITKTLQAKFPGGVWRPHYSLFNQAEIYYTYETAK